MNKFFWDGFRLGAVCAVLFFAAFCSGSVRSQKLGSPALNPEEVFSQAGRIENPSKESLLLESLEIDVVNWSRRIIEDSKNVFLRTDNLSALLFAGGASIAMHNSDADKNIAEHFDRHGAFHGFTDESFNIIGHPGTHFAATGLWYGLSAESGDELNKERAWTMMTAVSVNWVATMGLKFIRDNDTPNGKRWAWPSGHTSSSFTVASVLDEFYGPKVGVPAYILASLVGYRMADTGDHWASDVVFGATLGWVVGHTIAGKHKEIEIAGFKLLPYMGGADGSAAGISFVKQF
ncbi:MAG: phosphatase PAP2 family protein [Planctomycetes bacterium]|nr:phosphatase PAP2 family protein [Planctomycetota bacterium]